MSRVLAALRICCFLGFFSLTGAMAADFDFGKPGEPIKLVVGHPSHYAATWSVHVLHAKELWKKYLPAGSTVEYQTGLSGAVIVNNMLAGKQYIGYLGDTPPAASTPQTEKAPTPLPSPLTPRHEPSKRV